eukprot:CAMPEP_0119517550 /NCGR_PEP_ID=MMETSP1344-20130328/34409_1 /TAXON_ID=236787 /ORGANISM="Florenciella parvula, Strain CCMP2471" /LENGTH=73 /DNA_ID=CAMNT_0007555149 /DNA_START=205 /DNA_END=426 /DNA_ORIENTATION=+
MRVYMASSSSMVESRVSLTRAASLCMILAWILPTAAVSNVGRGGTSVADEELAEDADDDEDNKEDDEACEVEE